MASSPYRPPSCLQKRSPDTSKNENAQERCEGVEGGVSLTCTSTTITSGSTIAPARGREELCIETLCPGQRPPPSATHSRRRQQRGEHLQTPVDPVRRLHRRHVVEHASGRSARRLKMHHHNGIERQSSAERHEGSSRFDSRIRSRRETTAVHVTRFVTVPSTGTTST